jgi:cell division protein FtsB
MQADLATLANGVFGGGAVALALAALVNSVAYVLRRRVDVSAALVQELLARVTHLESQARARDAEIRVLHGRINALVDENEMLRDSISLGRVIPERARRDDTGKHRPGALTASIAGGEG